MENIIGPLNNQSKMFTFFLYSRDLRKGLDRLMIARKMSTKREAQMRGYLLVLLQKLLFFPCLVMCVSLHSESQTKESKI